MTMTCGSLAAVEYALPRRVVSTQDLAAEFPEWEVEKIEAQTGISERHIAMSEECASDLAVEAAHKLFNSGVSQPSEIDFILFCTQSPDHFLPTTACIIQDRLGIPKCAGAYDFSLGSSGYVYGLGQAEGLIATRQASNVLLLTAETYSKFINQADRSVRTIFGDAGTATLIRGIECDSPRFGPIVYGTDGSGARNLIVPAGGLRQPRTEATALTSIDAQGNVRSADNLFMDGAEIFSFTLNAAPSSVKRLLEKAALTLDDIDLFVFHQANRYMLEYLRKKIKIPENKFVVSMGHCGNTGSSSIPIALRDAMESGRVESGSRLMLVGFGPGYSWAGTLLRAA